MTVFFNNALEVELKDVEYIGDGAYVGHDGYQVWIYTDNGVVKQNPVALERSVFKRLMQYGAALYGLNESTAQATEAPRQEPQSSSSFEKWADGFSSLEEDEI